MNTDHRHRYGWVPTSPGAMTSKRVCLDCGHDPWLAAYERNIAKASRRISL